MGKQLISTSANPRIYHAECIEKGIRRCSRCGDVKSLDSFGIACDTGYYSAHCHTCEAEARKKYISRLKGKELSKFKNKKRLDNKKGIKELRKSHLADSLVVGLSNYLKRRDLKPDYRTIHKGITPEMIEAKKNLILLTRGLRQIKK